VRYVRRLSFCLMAAGAFGALGASASSAALPEFVGAMPLAFESTLKATTLETVAGPKITCTGGVDAGQVTGAKSLTVKITFTGCMLNGIACRSGSIAGAIETPVLTGTLGYIKASSKQVGLDLSQPAGAPFLDFTCGEDLTLVVKGSVIGTVKPVNKNVAPPKHFTLMLSEKKGKQKPTKLEGGPVDVLETSFAGGPFEPSGLASTDELHFAGPLLIAA
jgi:hypothetical protein